MLEASYIIFTLHPYYKNYEKRLVKTPKIYFTETSLVTALLGIKSPEQVQLHPLVGNIFENLVVSELLKAQLNKREQPNLFFYREFLWVGNRSHQRGTACASSHRSQICNDVFPCSVQESEEVHETETSGIKARAHLRRKQHGHVGGSKYCLI